jgi:RNA-directed DNA polymerase
MGGTNCQRAETPLSKNGAWDKGNIYSKLRSHTSLKEMYLVRYADDFKIFCRTGEEAQRAFMPHKNGSEKD